MSVFVSSVFRILISAIVYFSFFFYNISVYINCYGCSAVVGVATLSNTLIFVTLREREREKNVNEWRKKMNTIKKFIRTLIDIKLIQLHLHTIILSYMKQFNAGFLDWKKKIIIIEHKQSSRARRTNGTM